MRSIHSLAPLWVLAAIAGGCKSDSSKSGDKPPAPAPTPTPSPAPAPPTPAPPTPAPPTPAPPAATGSITFDTQPDDASCLAYLPKQGGAAVPVPKAISEALACPIMPPVVLPTGDGFVYLTGHDLRFWKNGPDPDKRLVLFDGKPDDEEFAVSMPVWSPDGTKLALVSKASGYPEKTRLFVLTVSPAGEVTGKVKHDVGVFSPCGSVCTPQPPVWKNGATVEVTTVGDGEPGAPRAFTL